MGSSPIFRASKIARIAKLVIGNYLYVLIWKVSKHGCSALDWKSNQLGSIPRPFTLILSKPLK